MSTCTSGILSVSRYRPTVMGYDGQDTRRSLLFCQNSSRGYRPSSCSDRITAPYSCVNLIIALGHKKEYWSSDHGGLPLHSFFVEKQNHCFLFLLRVCVRPYASVKCAFVCLCVSFPFHLSCTSSSLFVCLLFHSFIHSFILSFFLSFFLSFSLSLFLSFSFSFSLSLSLSFFLSWICSSVTLF